MEWKTSWLEKTDDEDALKKQLQSEGFDTSQWSGRPGGKYLNCINVCADAFKAFDEVLCVLSGTAEVKVNGEKDTVHRGDRIDVPAHIYRSLTVTSTEPLVVLTGIRLNNLSCYLQGFNQ
ncbi:cupin domain-containing protein [Candidatus Poribacteria bacterium]|nr:cupin domain-containing protein [Candidatus Poribacteria bacterium]